MDTPIADAALAGEAADWMIRLDQGRLDPLEQQAFERWRGQSPAHAAAWRRAEAVMQAIGSIPRATRSAALRELAGNDRRRALKLALMLAAAPAAWMAWRMPWAEWNADLRTATGERRREILPDGSTLVLNTASAVTLAFSADERRLRLLSGEILVSTGRDPAPRHRPFIVETAQGVVRALGTRFTVRQLPELTRVGVLEHAVEISTSGGAVARVEAGQAAEFGAQGLAGAVRALDPAPALWENGLFLAQKLPLGELLAELGRYRKGVLRCDPAVAGMLVSGAFSVADTDAALRLLARSLPLRVRSWSRYWVSVEAA